MITEDEIVRDKAINSDGPEKKAASPVFWASIMLLSGTCTTLFAKVQFDISAKGLDTCNVGDDDEYNCKFQKPWFSVLEMKCAMALCAPIFYGLGWGRPDSQSDPRGHSPSAEALKAVWLPALLDLLNTVLGNIGLVWVSSSIYQMTRGSVVIFSAILSVQWLGKTLRSFHYWSISFVVMAVILVGVAGTYPTYLPTFLPTYLPTYLPREGGRQEGRKEGRKEEWEGHADQGADYHHRPRFANRLLNLIKVHTANT